MSRWMESASRPKVRYRAKDEGADRRLDELSNTYRNQPDTRFASNADDDAEVS